MAGSRLRSRFTDADKEPTKTLTPIEGYEKKPLVSLKEALTGIEPPIHNLAAMLWTAERNSCSPSDGLTPEESAAIRLYTMEWPENSQNIYVLLNGKLRLEQRNELKPWFSYLKLIMTALYKLPSLQATIYRGVRGNFCSIYETDFIWWGFSSCAQTQEAAENFVGRSGVRTIFIIDCVNGKAIKSHSHYPAEEEILLMPGTFLRVMGKPSLIDGQYIIKLKEETPPFQLMTSPMDSLSKKTASTKSYEPKRKLLLSSPPEYQNASLQQTIQDNKGETSLNLSIKKLNDDDMSIVAYYLLLNNPVYTRGYSFFGGIRYKVAKLLGEGLQSNSTLTQLYLSDNQIGDKGAQYLGEGLQNNSTLTQLYLSANRIGAAGAHYLGEALQNNSRLTELNLSGNQIGAEGAHYLGEALRNNSRLTELYLSANQIGDQGAHYLGEALQNNSTLTQLNLWSNQIGDQGAHYLSEALQNNSTLTQLNLWSNQIGDQGAQYLKQHKKECLFLSL